VRGAAAVVVVVALAFASLIAPVAASASSAAPLVERETLTRLTPGDATLTARINSGVLETSYQFELMRTCPESANGGATCEWVETIPLPTGTIPPSASGQGVTVRLNHVGVTLSPGSAYSYSVSATNSLGSAHGVWQSFAAPLPGLPAIYSESVSHVSAHEATIGARINPEGSEVEYEVWFWPGCGYGFCERAPPHVVASGHLIAGTMVRSVSTRLTGLTPGEPNNGYWVVATNSNGTSEGILQTFPTP
jgi:hypothetical protein